MNYQFDIVSKIKSLEEELKTSEKKVAQVIMSDLEWAGNASIHEIASAAGVSEASVTRFSRSVGCKNVPDLKKSLVSSFAIGQRFLEGHMDPITEESGAIGQVVKGIIEALNTVNTQTSQKKIEQVAQLIHSVDKVVVFGSGGGATVIADDAVNRMFRFGVNISSYNDFLMQRMVASSLDEKSLVLVISTTGQIAEINDCAQIAKQYGAQVVAITRGDSPLAQLANIHLQVHIAEEEGIYKATASRYALLAVVDAIALELAILRKDSAKESLRRIKYNLDTVRGGDRRFPVGD
ncbi:MurR/RpiR family transcriptional regulator [Lentisphaera profundi]|uniref:MurR/RpiR family transcriptional regulator n=1 Tax=Lentisphaera profundi TaxID=1658616 RepID=A0ABY7VZW1_9BACT|nr:MurR/RpiR family transcriptional regulator [Lentisphaera profundi]WDE99247.1 MurR/RpiR family transcriptional regulator [Lentisphaera profundi]